MSVEENVTVNDSILNSIKKLIGPGVEHTFFDQDLITHINTAFFVLSQLGVGPSTPFTISSDSETWADFMSDEAKFRAVVDYVYLRVRQIFDPPTNSFVVSSLEKQQNELEWRLNVMAETPTWEEE